MGKWRVDVFRNRLLQLGTVTAPNAQEALNSSLQSISYRSGSSRQGNNYQAGNISAKADAHILSILGRLGILCAVRDRTGQPAAIFRARARASFAWRGVLRGVDVFLGVTFTMEDVSNSRAAFNQC